MVKCITQHTSKPQDYTCTYTKCMYMEAAQTHPIHLTVTGAHAFNINSYLTKQSRGNPQAV